MEKTIEEDKIINQMKILFPMLLECINYVESFVWKNILENLAYGQPPANFYMHHNSVCYLDNKMKKNSFLLIPAQTHSGCEWDENNIRKFTDDLVSFFRCKIPYSCIDTTVADTEERILIFDDKCIVEATAVGMRKKNIKEILIDLFVIKLRDMCNLTVNQAKYLKSVILLSIIFKASKINDYVIKNDRIESIKYIQVSADKKISINLQKLEDC